MVTEAEYEEWSRKTTRSLEFEDLVDQFHSNQKYQYILIELAKVFKNVVTFEDLEKLSIQEVISHLSSFANVINMFPEIPGAVYAIDIILSSHNLDYDVLKELFLNLSGSPTAYSIPRESVANELIRKLTKNHDDFLDLFSNANVPLIDQAILILGLPVVINDKNRAKVLNIISKNICSGRHLDSCITAARKIKAVELKPEFENALRQATDKYFIRKLEKLLASPKWQQ